MQANGDRACYQRLVLDGVPWLRACKPAAAEDPCAICLHTSQNLIKKGTSAIREKLSGAVCELVSWIHSFMRSFLCAIAVSEERHFYGYKLRNSRNVQGLRFRTGRRRRANELCYNLIWLSLWSGIICKILHSACYDCARVLSIL